MHDTSFTAPASLACTLGRLDSQVKQRGFRIELGEIEAELSRLPGVRTSALVLRGEDTAEHLAAFLVASSFDGRALRTGLSDRLPAYMVPELELLKGAPPARRPRSRRTRSQGSLIDNVVLRWETCLQRRHESAGLSRDAGLLCIFCDIALDASL